MGKLHVHLVAIILIYTFMLQNENVQRGHTSERVYVDIRRPNRRTPLKVLVDKTLGFVEDVWSTYMKRNMQVTGYVYMYMRIQSCDYCNVNSISM